MSKTERYGWTPADETQEGKFERIEKNRLSVDAAYQREVRPPQVMGIARNFTWSAFGTLIVFLRDDGVCAIVDGQHRWEAAMRRAEVTHVPCMVYRSESVAEEAAAFRIANISRRPVSALAKHRVDLVMGDPVAIEIEDLAASAGRVIAGSSDSRRICCVALMRTLLTRHKSSLLAMWPAITRACEGIAINERVIAGLTWLHANVDEDLSDTRWSTRIAEIGGRELLICAQRAASFYARGGAAVWGRGILERINKGLRNKIKIRVQGED